MNKKEVIESYNLLKTFGARCYHRGLFDACIKYVKAASRWAYFYNVAFMDEDLEELTQSLSKSIVVCKTSYETDAHNVVFYDSYAYSQRGLTQQYIRALMAMKLNIMYITDASANSEMALDIYEELHCYPQARVINVPSRKTGLRRAQYIYDEIIGFHPSKVFMHLSPHTVETIMAMHALPKAITRYQINLTDHTFWLGATALDYSLEFRPMGIKASIEKRKIPQSKLLLCPYYPIIDNLPFEGFSFEKSNDNVIIFSGGASYKYLDTDATYAQIIQKVLSENPLAIWVHAGECDEVIMKMMDGVVDSKSRQRLYFIGNRKDISECFMHSDIYVNSFPVGGGLMLLYAAHYSKPIVSLNTPLSTADDVISQVRSIHVSSDSVDELYSELYQLISDKIYRIKKGKQVHEAIVVEETFQKNLHTICSNNVNVISYDLPHDPVLLPSLEEKIEYESRTAECERWIIGILGWRACRISISYIRPVLKWYHNKVKRNIRKYL